MMEPSRPGSFVGFLGFGVNSYIDAEVESDQLKGNKDFTTLNLDFNLNAPLAGIAPGVSFGVLDANNTSPEGRRAYVAVSFQDAGTGGVFSGGASVETTIGAFVGKTSHAFVGVSLPVNEQFRFLAEDDGESINAGAELRLDNGPYFRLVFREDQTLLSVGATTHF